MIEPLGIELGIWHGSYQNQTLSWLWWWDSEGNFLLIGAERVEVEKARGDRLANIAEQEHQQVEQAHQQAEQAHQQVEQERQRAEKERQQVEQSELARRNAIPQLLATGMSVEQVAQNISGRTNPAIIQDLPKNWV